MAASISTHPSDPPVLLPAHSESDPAAHFTQTPRWPDSAEPDSKSRGWPAFIRAYAEGQWDPYKVPLPPVPTQVIGAPDPIKAGRSRRLSLGSVLGISSLRRSAKTQPFVTSPKPADFPSHLSSPLHSPPTPTTTSIAARRGAETPDLRIQSKTRAPTSNAQLAGPRMQPDFLSAASPSDAFLPSGLSTAELGLEAPLQQMSLHTASYSFPNLLESVSTGPTSHQLSSNAHWNMLGSSAQHSLHIPSQLGRPGQDASTGPGIGSVDTKQAPNRGRESVESSSPSTPTKPSRHGQSYFQSSPSPWGSPGSVTSHRSSQSIDAASGTVSVPVHRLQRGIPTERGDYFGSTTASTERRTQARTPELRRAPTTALPAYLTRYEENSDGVIHSDIFLGCEPRRALQVAGVHLNASASEPELHETWYNRMGYLLPPMPSDEVEGRRALHRFGLTAGVIPLLTDDYRYNVLHTAKDVNFDRITYLAKLVFNTKMVLVSLIDEKHQWQKSESK